MLYNESGKEGFSQVSVTQMKVGSSNLILKMNLLNLAEREAMLVYTKEKIWHFISFLNYYSV